MSDPLVGAVLDGRYRVEARIATGGMSTVYRGTDLRLDRPVALKVMDARYAGDPQFLTRFAKEARAIARLKDPGLVAIYDQGDDPAQPYLVMELVEGGTLRELLSERGPMPPHAMAAVLRPVLSGLGVAHRSGLVHRDIKPENVLISDDGEVKLVDFGLVRAVAEAGITSASVILGTAAYLSPEQVTGVKTGPRSDVYSAGIMAFELLTGATPFGGDNPMAVAQQRLDRDVPPPSSMIAGIDPQLDPACGQGGGEAGHVDVQILAEPGDVLQAGGVAVVVGGDEQRRGAQRGDDVGVAGDEGGDAHACQGSAGSCGGDGLERLGGDRAGPDRVVG
jgi:serine/threonine-protein kinase